MDVLVMVWFQVIKKKEVFKLYQLMGNYFKSTWEHEEIEETMQAIA